MVLKENPFHKCLCQTLFDTRINHQITPYVSYRADPAAFAINAFHMSWQHHLFYASPPFSLIRVLQKIQEEKATGLLLVPKWPTQLWWPKLMQMFSNHQYNFQGTETLCFYPATHRKSTHSTRNCVWFYVTCPEIPQWKRPFDNTYYSHGTILEARHYKAICYLPSEMEALL